MVVGFFILYLQNFTNLLFCKKLLDFYKIILYYTYKDISFK